ncbi:MAG: 50S ribosomal protein L25, partial [Dactylosporangium sp.]|nr:50S ribosomal protein L25 [Dactylosporangium sp.]
MSEVKISAEPRTEFGKGGARRIRRAGKVPAVLYGHGEKPKHISLPAREFAAAIRHGGANQVFNIEISDGTTTLALTKAIQRDPVKDIIEHVDLLIVRRGERVTVEVPVQLVGEPAKDTLVVT